MTQQTEKTKADFDEYYWRNIYPLMLDKEKVRKRYLANLKRLIAISAIVLPLVIWFAWKCVNEYDQEWAANVTYFAIAVNAFILRGPFKIYKKLVKNDIMNLFIKFFEGFSYKQGAGLSYYEIIDSNIFPKFDRIETDDCFYGTYHDVQVRVCEEKLIKSRVDSKGRRHNETMFFGIVLELDMNKKFLYQTYVTKDRGILNRFSKKSGFEKVALEDVVFEKAFEAYSENQIEARYLLTTAFMERMLKLKEAYKGKDIQFSFYDSKVMIAINTKEDMFEPCSLLKTNLREEQVYKVYDQFMMIFSIIDMLKLNQRTGL